MKKKSRKQKTLINKFRSWVWPNKLHFAITLFVALLVVGGTAAAVYKVTRNSGPTDNTQINTQENTSDSDESQEDEVTDKEDAAKEPRQNTNPQPSKKPPANEPFAVTKVFFREYPTAPPEAGWGQCHDGQTVTFTVTAEVTHTGTGTVEYHWEMADPMKGTIQKFENKSQSFAGSGVTKISTELTYTTYDTSPYTGISIPGYYNRPHMNLFFTKPNEMYANKEAPVYTYSNVTGSWESFFIWGNYLNGLCGGESA